MLKTEVINGLWISNWQEARDARERGWPCHIVTVAIDSPFVGNEKFDLVDGPGNNPDVFKAAVNAVVAAFGNKKPVLVHCVSGRSRSAAVIVAALSQTGARSICEAYDLLISRYDATRIHPALASLFT